MLKPVKLKDGIFHRKDVDICFVMYNIEAGKFFVITNILLIKEFF